MRRFLTVFVFLLMATSAAYAQETQASPYDIALARIEEAAQTDATTLDLSNLGLTALPPEIGLLTNLRGLYIGHNALTALPPEIGKLTQLTILYAMDNALSSLPAQISNLKNLCALELGHNQLTDLPDLPHLSCQGKGALTLR